MVEDGLDKVEDPAKNALYSAKDAVKSADSRIAELELEVERVNRIREEQKEINDKLTKQLDLKLSNLKDPEQFLPKKTAALEVYNENITARNTYIFAMITSFFIAASSAYFVFAGAIVAGIVCMGFAVMLLKKMQKIKYLEEKYNLIRPKMFKKAT